MLKALTSVLALCCALAPPGIGAQGPNATPVIGGGNRPQGATNYFNVAVPAHSYDLILARPEKDRVTLSVLAYEDMDGFAAWGAEPGGFAKHTAVEHF
ncbi:MAG: hypothetical protein ABSA47_13255, partial [Verrucomicrobiota bacterium]